MHVVPKYASLRSLTKNSVLKGFQTDQTPLISLDSLNSAKGFQEGHITISRVLIFESLINNVANFCLVHEWRFKFLPSYVR